MRRRDSLVAVALLIALLSAVAALGARAVRASLSNRQMVQRTLFHHATVASWELSRSLRLELQNAASITAWTPLQRLLRGRDPEQLPTARAIGRVLEVRCDCPVLSPASNVYRLVLAGSRLDASGSFRDAADSLRLIDLLDRVAAANSKIDRPDPCAFVVDHGRGDEGNGGRALAIAVVYDAPRSPRAVYAIEVPLSSLGSVIERAVQHSALLPPGILDSAGRARFITLSVRSGTNAPALFEPRPVSGVAASSSLPADAGDSITVTAGVSYDAASVLLPGGIPGTDVPQIVLLCAAVAVLLGLSVAQYHRTVELARVRSEIDAGLSHELNTPLALVRVYAETLLLERQTSESERHAFLSVILREIKRLSALVENILTFSRMERNQVAVSLRPIQLDELMMSLIGDLQPFAAQHDMSVALVSHVDVAVVADPAALRQIALNILTNAIKYGPRGQVIRAQAAIAGGRVHLTIDDEGPGIPMTDRRRVFERYTRLVPPDPSSPAGSGIGLAVVAELAAAQGIDVSIDDAPCGGARFTLAIPMANVLDHAGVRDGALRGAIDGAMAP